MTKENKVFIAAIVFGAPIAAVALKLYVLLVIAVAGFLGQGVG